MDKKLRETTDLFVEIMGSKREGKERLGHVVQTVAFAVWRKWEWMNEWMNEWMKWMNEESWMIGQQTCPLTIHFNMSTVSSDVSIQRPHWQPLSVHLRAYCTHPAHDVNDVMCEGWPQHRFLRPLLFSNSGVGSFTSHKNQISVSAVRQDLWFFVLIRED